MLPHCRAKQQNLEERQADVEYELRCLLNKPGVFGLIMFRERRVKPIAFMCFCVMLDSGDKANCCHQHFISIHVILFKKTNKLTNVVVFYLTKNAHGFNH